MMSASFLHRIHLSPVAGCRVPPDHTEHRSIMVPSQVTQKVDWPVNAVIRRWTSINWPASRFTD
jgi:hypothetical protein